MKRMSLKWKVTLWYASMLLLMVVLLFGFLMSVADQLFRSQSVSVLEGAVWDFAKEIDIEDGMWELDDDARFYGNDMVFSIYDEQGRLVAGSVPKNFPEDTMLKANTMQEFSEGFGKWMTYDAAIIYGDGNILWIRGVYSSDMLPALEKLMFRVLLVACPILIAVALLVGYYITRQALLPMEEIRKTAEEIGGGSDLSLRIPIKRARGEVRQLTDTFNNMFARLENSFEKERQFTSDASHELRTPVSVILSEAEYALLPDTEPEEQREGLEIIRQQAERMAALLSQLLLLARADNGRAQLVKEVFDASVLALDALEEMSARASACRIELLSDIQTGLLVQGDRGSLMRVFRNLLENAVQYGKEGGWVMLTASREQGMAVFRVEDNGIGIAPEHLDKIWNRFYRIDTVRGSEYGNSGLGLPIVKWTVEEHGGTIEVESRPGEGSCFTVRLPEAEDGDSAP